MNYNVIYDEGEGLASPFVKGKSLSQQLREEREELEREAEKAIRNNNKLADYYFTKQKRPQLQYAKINPKAKSAYFVQRGTDFAFANPYAELEGLEVEVLKYYPTNHTLRDKVRFQELIAAKRMFIFFATIYLKLTSFRIAEYLDMNRSTLSHHIYAAMDELDTYSQVQLTAQKIEDYLWTRHEQLRS
jgi:adenine-specific DNA methylase